jgi:hypothetical protein
MRPVLRRLAIFALPVLILLMPASVGAFPLTNCTLDLTSLDANGVALDTATAGGEDATLAAPFLVDWDGTVAWVGTMGTQVITDHHWGVSVFLIPTPLSGGDPNEGGDTTGDGTVDVGINLPFRVTGLFHVSGSIAGTGGSCAGSGWMRLVGDPFGTVGFWLGLLLILLGLLGLWRGYRGSAVLAIIGGVLLGLGAADMLIIYALMPLAEWTPWAALLGGLVIGVVVLMVRQRPVAVAVDEA